MAVAYKILGQSAPSSTSNVDMITVGAGKSHIVSTLVILNTTTSAVTCNVYARIGGATAAAGNALLYNTTILGGLTTAFTLGITLAATDVLTVQTSVSNALTFTAFGSEIS
jgi:hypothetical protein